MEVVGIDLFAGAGGLSLGAEMAGINVEIAIESDVYAAATYSHNHPNTKVVVDDIRNITDISCLADQLVLFGGPPCQGFSTSNQRTRNKNNPKNWLFREFIRVVKLLKPTWVLIENVSGIVQTEHGYFSDLILSEIQKLGYTCSVMVLCASDYGVPQARSRFFLVGSCYGKTICKPKIATSVVTVDEAISDLPVLSNGASVDIMRYKIEDAKQISSYAQMLRGNLEECSGHLVTKNSDKVVERYKHIPPGGNWKDIPNELMMNYKDKSRCHTGIYRRLLPDEPAITVGNYRKSMLIHPREDRGLSVREAARLQSFPDNYKFFGSIGFQQQQVGNAVPPILAKCVFQEIIKAM